MSLGFGDRLRHAEVHDHRMSAGEENVFRFDVAVHHAALVRGSERVGDFAQQSHGLIHRQLAAARETLAQRLAVDVRHHVVEEAVHFT